MTNMLPSPESAFVYHSYESYCASKIQIDLTGFFLSLHRFKNKKKIEQYDFILIAIYFQVRAIRRFMTKEVIALILFSQTALELKNDDQKQSVHLLYCI